MRETLDKAILCGLNLGGGFQQKLHVVERKIVWQGTAIVRACGFRPRIAGKGDGSPVIDRAAECLGYSALPGGQRGENSYSEWATCHAKLPSLEPIYLVQ